MNKQPLWQTWSAEKVSDFQIDFLTWYQKNKRTLPWRINTEPYRIWISEIMLQQTRVETVIDYFNRFMEWFPTIEALAAAPEERLLKAWEGLGYYSRARNIQAAAQQIVETYGGKVPCQLVEIQKLKGIGPYTAGAIASIAFELPEPAIDGNVMRVASRLFAIDADIAKASSRKIFDEAVRTVISHEAPGDFNQAFMDLGSQICTPKSPKCEICPLISYCFAFENNCQPDFPVKTKKMKPKDVYLVAGIIENNQEEVLLTQRQNKGLLANLWTFPLREVSQPEFNELKNLWGQNSEAEFQLPLVAENAEPEIFAELPVIWQKQHYPEVTHIFTHLKWHVLPFYGRVAANFPFGEKSEWLSVEQFTDFTFPKIQHKLLASWQTKID
ncbi:MULTISPECIES: A/G-specific adenine glycosylase [unclassified Enterococcus]|uniref:A/G-specific adenine glycosylase n=1 Tax=unclassified Enterococcus TaxID=2608891 RepID=UPI002474C1A0|nr:MULTISPECIES: A/G-specific adenine glycosylase [unclassified Enterococcus]